MPIPAIAIDRLEETDAWRYFKDFKIYTRMYVQFCDERMFRYWIDPSSDEYA